MTRRLGPHAILNTPQSRDWASRASVVKGVGNVAVLEAAPAAALRVYRWRWSPAEQDAILDARDADRVANTILNGLAGYRQANLFVEVLNEIGKGRLTAYLALLAAVVPRLHAAGLKVAGPSWGTGDYEQADWDALRQVKWCGLDAVALHAYWGSQGFTVWNALRYRTYWRPGQGDPALLLVTECGRDAIEGGKGGWQADGLTDEQYVGELTAYDAEIARDAGAHATGFTCGPTSDWSNYDLDPLVGWLVAAGPPEFYSPVPPAPQEPPVPDVALSVTERHSHAAPENYETTGFGPSVGVVVHSTDGPASTVESEYISTINYFENPTSDVSAQRIIGGGAFHQVNTSVHDREVAYHARDPANHRRHSLELAHPADPHDAWVNVPYEPFQYEAAGELIARWRIADEARGESWPLRLLTRAELAANENAPGIAYHRDLPAGIREGKQDPFGPFDGAALVAAATRWYQRLTGGPPMADTDATLLDQLYALAGQIQALEARWAAINCPHRAAYVGKQGESIKEWVNCAKGQK